MGFNIEFSSRQSEAFRILEAEKKGEKGNIGWERLIELMYGGAKFGGKSVFIVYYTFLYARKIIKLCSLTSQKYPVCVGFLGRKRGTDFNKTTLETWKRFIPVSMFEIKAQAKSIYINNTVSIDFGGMDDEETVNKFNSAEYAYIGIDQAEELERDDWAKLRGAHRLQIKNPETGKQVQVPLRMLLTSNPADCPLSLDFNPEGDPNVKIPKYRHFVPALPKDNEFADNVSYVQQLNEAWKHRPEILEAYRDGIWKNLRGFNTLIHKEWVLSAIRKETESQTTVRRLISVDPARFGDDETVIYVLENYTVLECVTMFHADGDEIAIRIIKLCEQYKINYVVLDIIGIGVGVSNSLKLLSPDIVRFELNSEATPENEEDAEKYSNVRSAMWWKTADLFAEGKICQLPNDDKLISDLTTVRYRFVRGKRAVELKDDIKKRLGRSPDRGDALVMGIYGMDKAPEWFCDINYGNKQFIYKSRPRGYGR